MRTGRKFVIKGAHSAPWRWWWRTMRCARRGACLRGVFLNVEKTWSESGV